MSSASRRKFLWLGGGVAASLLLFPDSSLAAKVARAVKGAADKAKGAKSGSGARAASKSASRTKSVGTRAATASKRSTGTKGRATSAAKSGKASTVARGSARRSSRGVAAARSRVAPATETAKLDDAFAPSRLESPSSFSPGRAFSFGGGSAARDLSLYNVHTGERLDVEYYVNGRYESDALRAFDNLLRDYHTDEICQFDPRVLNQLYDLRNSLGSRETFHVCSGYRSPTTNENYRRAGARVAEHSYHMTGQAIDIYLPGRDIRQLRNVALAMRSGGVGYYPSDGFVHLDSGPVRRW